MTRDSGSPLLTAAFGDLAAGVWGALWATSGNAVLLLGGEPGQPAQVMSGVELDGDRSEQEWSVHADGAGLLLAPEGDAIAISVELASGQEGGFEQLCRARGRAVIGGQEREIDCQGRRATRAGLDLRRYASVRDVSAWFDREDGIGLLSLRPRRARGHDEDEVSAAVIEGTSATAVTDARLSTAYDENGAPLRAGFELWLGGQDGEEYPRRAAGEAVGARARAATDEVELEADLLRWHSRGRDGVGVYLLARPR